MQGNRVFLSVDAVPYSEILQSKIDSLSYKDSPRRGDTISRSNENTFSGSSRNLRSKDILQESKGYKKSPSLKQLLSTNPVLKVITCSHYQIS